MDVLFMSLVCGVLHGCALYELSVWHAAKASAEEHGLV